MKKITYLFSTIILAIIFTTQSYSQTTQEEYNYITKGYKVQVESGLDMKKGYELVDLGNSGLDAGSEHRECIFKGLVRTGQNKPCAIMMVYHRTDISNGVTWYVCIPSANSSEEIWQQTLNFINENFKDNNIMMQTIVWSLMKLSSQEAGK